jgi:kynurenine formamidase
MIRVQAAIGNKVYRLGRAIDLAVPLDFHGSQPSAYGVPRASARPYSGDGFVLDTRAGGPCNCEILELVPHCHGTHTESVGHLTVERLPISAVLPEPFSPCSVITLEPAGRQIGVAALERALALTDPDFLEALVVRTLPNSADKATRRWEDAGTPYFTPEAMTLVRERQVNHLLVDLPSLDPLRDEGRLTAHRIFWGMPPGSREVPTGPAALRTVTEMIYVPDEVPDGSYLLELQLPRLVSDAVPSRPLLFFLEEIR